MGGEPLSFRWYREFICGTFSILMGERSRGRKPLLGIYGPFPFPFPFPPSGSTSAISGLRACVCIRPYGCAQGPPRG